MKCSLKIIDFIYFRGNNGQKRWKVSDSKQIRSDKKRKMREAVR